MLDVNALCLSLPFANVQSMKKRRTLFSLSVLTSLAASVLVWGLLCWPIDHFN